ncbi:MAG: hypothetical protein GX665_04060 [Gammaproteobacteria bacterium]|nr:hypothetical protein [Gammaproteobacteria bacterium]
MNSLALVTWRAGDQQFAVEASRILTLQPYSNNMDCHSLHQLLPGLDAEAPAYCLGWQADGHTCWLATRDEPLHLQLPLDALWPLPASLQKARQNPAIRALGWHRGRPLTLLDTRELARQFHPPAPTGSSSPRAHDF